MATLIPFNPSNLFPFQFQPVLDGETYSATVLYNNYSQRYFLSISTFSNVLQLYTPLTASPDVVLQGAICTANSDQIVLTNRNGNIYPGQLITGSTIAANTYVKTLYGSLVVMNQNAISSTASGQATTLAFTYSINLTKGYFTTPIVYRASSGNIEIG